MPERKRLSPHFNLWEFHSRDGREVPESHEKALRDLCEKVLEPMRREFGPCRVHSGYRSPAHNRRVGGARASYHVYETKQAREVAADVSFAKGSPAAWKRRARELLTKRYGRTRGGIGFYPRGGFVHIDTRIAGPAAWNGP